MRKFLIILMINGFFILGLFSIHSFASIQDTTKVINIYLNITNNTFYEVGKEILYNHPTNVGLQPARFNIEIISNDGIIIKNFSLCDPRISFGDDVIIDENGSLGPLISKVVYADNINFTITVPFYKNAQSLKISDSETYQELILINLQDIICDFCNKYSNDPDCQLISGVLLAILVTFILIVIILIVIFTIKFLKKKK